MKTAALLILFLILGMGAGAFLFTAINPSYELGLALAALLATVAAGVGLVTLWQGKGE
jgi:hypothetical protein